MTSMEPRHLRITFDFTLYEDIDPIEFGDALFDLICANPLDSPGGDWSCDGFDPPQET